MNEIYVTGHRNPDTDSIVAALSYAALKNALGEKEYVAVHHQRRDQPHAEALWL